MVTEELLGLLLKYKLGFNELDQLGLCIAADEDSSEKELCLLSQFDDVQLENRLLQNPNLPRKAVLTIFARFEKRVSNPLYPEIYKFFKQLKYYNLHISCVEDKILSLLERHHPVVDFFFWYPEDYFGSEELSADFASFAWRADASQFVKLVSKKPGLIWLFAAMKAEYVEELWSCLKDREEWVRGMILAFRSCPRRIRREACHGLSADFFEYHLNKDLPTQLVALSKKERKSIAAGLKLL